VEYALRKTYNDATRWGAKIGSAFQALGNWAINGYTWEQAWSEYGEVSELIDQDINRKQAENEKRRADEYCGALYKDVARGIGTCLHRACHQHKPEYRRRHT
jgi:hypothetical protein